VIDDQLVHPYRVAFASFAGRGKPRVSGIIGRAGWYMGDMSCATMEGTFRAAYASAQTAIAGAQEILAGAPAAFSLCRPPGHLAYADRCSGFCLPQQCRHCRRDAAPGAKMKSIQRYSAIAGRGDLNRRPPLIATNCKTGAHFRRGLCLSGTNPRARQTPDS